MSATTTGTMSRTRHQKANAFNWAGALAALAAVFYVSGLPGSAGFGPLFGWAAVVIAAAPAAYLGWRIWKARADDIGVGLEVQFSLSVLAAVFITSNVATQTGLETYPAIYFALALLVTFQSRLVGGVAIGIALLLEWGSHLIGGPGGVLSSSGFDVGAIELTAAATHSAFIALFGLISVIVHGTEVLERRKMHRQEVEEQRQNLLREAREFRILSTRRNDTPSNRREAEELITRDAVDAVNHTIYVSLSLLKTALDAHTCILLWLDVRNEELRIKELVSDSDAIVEGTIDPARGVIGGITRRREPVSLRDVRTGFRGISYYHEPQDIDQFLGVPVIEDGHLRGVLCIDRNGGEAFDDDEAHVVEETASYIVRAVENERLFASIEKSKYELGRFFDASRRLNGVLTPAQVYDVALECAGEIAPYDFAGITLYDRAADTHEIVAVESAADYSCSSEEWRDRQFASNSGLVSMVVKNRHYLPYGGALRDPEPMVFTPDEGLHELQSMLVLPLIVQDRPIGTFIVAHRQAQRFTNERREMLEVVANQVAISLQNARLYSKMEEMATTDGLTGLWNHRTFQERLDETIARHRRSKKPFCLLLTDIDHFKEVNDTYGHPVGDEVLRQVARCFEDNLRETDVAARYGGEEFAIILEDTDIEGARVIAERIREEIKKLVFHTDQGAFSCSMSLGIGCMPVDASEKRELIDLTDRALYYSKDNGRDRVTSFHEIARRAS